MLIPRKNVDSPAIVLKLKYDKDADSVIDQIKRKQYPAKVAQHTDDLLLVGINYDKEQKTHECHIEKWKEQTTYYEASHFDDLNPLENVSYEQNGCAHPLTAG